MKKLKEDTLREFLRQRGNEPRSLRAKLAVRRCARGAAGLLENLRAAIGSGPPQPHMPQLKVAVNIGPDATDRQLQQMGGTSFALAYKSDGAGKLAGLGAPANTAVAFYLAFSLRVPRPSAVAPAAAGAQPRA
jgi:hypothetical protein